ncbi:MAG: protein-methionine-sulfoxide reductase catalytic subunit MsrP [Candidatus Puniceispirillales bacterium]
MYKKFIYKDNLITPPNIFFERRNLLKSLGFISSSFLLPSFKISAFADVPSLRKNQEFLNKRPLTQEKFATTYNNYYEFGSSKNIWRSAQKLKINPWIISVDGMVEKPLEINVLDLIDLMGQIEERVYRHRCVEAWAMTLPWLGFEFSKLIDYVKPLNNAKYVKFETFLDPKVARGQKQKWYPWPYTEGITIEEASNVLTFMATGIYGKDLPKQNGAPIRLVLPWKYGFKSIKSIKKITFTDKIPLSFWESLQPTEYGFWANVNPNIPHARWSQETEKLIGDEIKVVPTQLFNGYEEYVGHLYTKDQKYYF